MPPADVAEALERLRTPSADRYDVLLWALGAGAAVEEAAEASAIDPWFLAELAELARARADVRAPIDGLDAGRLRAARRAGLADRDIAAATGAGETAVGAAAAAPSACARPTTRSTPAPPSSRR